MFRLATYTKKRDLWCTPPRWRGRYACLYFWIALHVMPLSLYKILARTALHRDGHLNLYFHPWEFSDRLSDKTFGVPGYISGCSGSRLSQIRKVAPMARRTRMPFRTPPAIISDSMNRATTLIYRLYKSPFVRFAAVGAVATGINYGTFTLLILHFDDLWPEVACI